MKLVFYDKVLEACSYNGFVMVPFMNDHHEHWVSKPRQQSHCTIHSIAKAPAHRARELGWWFKVLVSCAEDLSPQHPHGDS